MTRQLLCLPLLLWLAPIAAAQDMPLSQILIDGEGWARVKRELYESRPPLPSRPVMLMIGDLPPGLGVFAQSHDKQTLYTASGKVAAITACPIRFDLKPAEWVRLSAPYCTLRTKRGEKTIEVGGLAVDKDGRIYAATEIGVQVFDPTGRLCGVLTPAAAGKPEFLAFEGEELTLWIKGEKYARKLNATGAK